MSVCLSKEVRKLMPVELYTLGNILSISDAWKKLMAIVPKEENIPRFSSEHIGMIEQAARQCNRNAAEIFLEEWSTMGRRRPTLSNLLELLTKAELFRAADYVACDILKQERPQRPDDGPAALIDTSDAAIEKLLEEKEMLLDEAFKSRLMKFSTTDTCETGDDRTTASAPGRRLNSSEDNKKETSSPGNPSDGIEYCQEIPSQELPVFLNDPAQSVISNEGMPSSEYLPVFLNNSAQSTVTADGEMSLSDLPSCLRQ